MNTNNTETAEVTTKKLNTRKYENYILEYPVSQMTPVGLDLGYSSSKISSLGILSTEPTAINFSIDSGIDYGDSNSYLFNDEDLLVGEEASKESFSTLDYKFKETYDPLIIFHTLFKLKAINFNEVDQNHLELRIGLALADWKHKDDYISRISEIHVDGRTFRFNNIKILPQGAGAYIDYISKVQNGIHLEDASLIDIGYNTINFLNFINGNPQKQYCRSYPGHGVSSIIKSFTDFLENEFAINFSEQEAIQIFLKGKFMFNGIEQEKVPLIINELKSNFLKKLRNSILVKERKLLSTSTKVIFAGGGSNLLANSVFPPNVDFVPEERMYSNVRGFMLV